MGIYFKLQNHLSIHIEWAPNLGKLNWYHLDEGCIHASNRIILGLSRFLSPSFSSKSTSQRKLKFTWFVKVYFQTCFFKSVFWCFFFKRKKSSLKVHKFSKVYISTKKIPKGFISTTTKTKTMKKLCTKRWKSLQADYLDNIIYFWSNWKFVGAGGAGVTQIQIERVFYC